MPRERLVDARDEKRNEGGREVLGFGRLDGVMHVKILIVAASVMPANSQSSKA